MVEHDIGAPQYTLLGALIKKYEMNAIIKSVISYFRFKSTPWQKWPNTKMCILIV